MHIMRSAHELEQQQQLSKCYSIAHTLCAQNEQRNRPRSTINQGPSVEIGIFHAGMCMSVERQI